MLSARPEHHGRGRRRPFAGAGQALPLAPPLLRGPYRPFATATAPLDAPGTLRPLTQGLVIEDPDEGPPEEFPEAIRKAVEARRLRGDRAAPRRAASEYFHGGGGGRLRDHKVPAEVGEPELDAQWWAAPDPLLDPDATANSLFGGALVLEDDDLFGKPKKAQQQQQPQQGRAGAQGRRQAGAPLAAPPAVGNRELGVAAARPPAAVSAGPQAPQGKPPAAQGQSSPLGEVCWPPRADAPSPKKQVAAAAAAAAESPGGGFGTPSGLSAADGRRVFTFDDEDEQEAAPPPPAAAAEEQRQAREEEQAAARAAEEQAAKAAAAAAALREAEEVEAIERQKRAFEAGAHIEMEAVTAGAGPASFFRFTCLHGD